MANKKQKKEKLSQKKSNKLIYIGIGIIAIFLLFIFLSYSSPNKVNEKIPSEGKFEKLDKPSTYKSGEVEIIEFIKFNCGHCFRLNEKMPELEKKYGNRLKIIHKPMLWYSVGTISAQVDEREIPLRKATEAAILAEKMGKGEEMRKALFNANFIEKSNLTDENNVENIARSVGLGDDFVKAWKRGDASYEFNSNLMEARSYSVDATPTIIINGNLKITPQMTDGDALKMADNIDIIINSLLNK